MLTRWRLSLRPWPLAIGLPIVIAAFMAAKVRAVGLGDPVLLFAVALLAALVVYTLWTVPPSWSLSAAVVLSMFGSNWGALHLPQSVAPDRWVLGIALVATAARAPGARNRRSIRFRPLYVLMYVAGAYAIGSAIADGTITHHAALFTLLDRMQILHWVVFIIAPAAFATRADRRVLLATLVGMGVYLGLTGIFEVLGPHALVFPRYISNPHVGIHYGRARGPFVEAVVNGLALYACIVASVIALYEWRSRGARVLAGAAIVVCAPSLLLTFQRSDWLGAGIGAVLTMVVVRELRRYLLPAALTVVGVVIVAFVAFPAVRNQARSRVQDIQTIQGRQALNDASLAMIQARPLFGFGWGRFQEVLPDYFQESDSYSFQTAVSNPVHNVYLSIATELGLLGIGLWLLVLLGGVGGAIVDPRAPVDVRPWQIGLGSLFIMWLVVGVSAPLAASFESLIIWLWAAAIVGAEPEGTDV